MTFQAAADEALRWIADHAPAGAPAPQALAAGERPGDAGIGLAPWRLDSPEVRRDGPEPVLTATARFALWAWSPDPLAAAAAIDALFFAAMTDPVWRLSEEAPPAAFWPGALPLSLTLACTVARATEARRPGIVEHPVVLDIRPRRAQP